MARKPRPVKIWNSYDEFGLINGLGVWSDDGQTLEYVRYPGETNKQLAARAKESRKNLGNSTMQGVVNNISRDLGISISGGGNLPWYNTRTRKIFHLSEKPYAGPSGVRVFVSVSGGWSAENEVVPQIRASGYALASSGFILWNQPDIIPNNIPSGLAGSQAWFTNQGIGDLYDAKIKYGDYTQILEFIGTSIPDTNDDVRVDYLVQTGLDTFGTAVTNTRSDFGHPDDPTDETFQGFKSALPTGVAAYNSYLSGHVAILPLNDLDNITISGSYYDSTGHGKDKLIELKKIVDDTYPLAWGRFHYDTGRWDQLNRASIGVVPAFHDEALPTVDIEAVIVDGSKYGTDLDVADIFISASGIRDPWYPMFQTGEFYKGNRRYYMFAKQQHEIVSLTTIGSIQSGVLTATGDDRPSELQVIVAQTSGKFFNDSELPDNPYIKELYEHTNPPENIFYRAPFIDLGGGLDPSGINYGGGSGFYYDYDTGNIFTSGVTAGNIVVVWDHKDVITSGIFVLFSGGFGFTTPDLNPLNDPDNKIYVIGN